MALDIGKFIERFVEESREHLSSLAEGIPTLAEGPSGGEALDAMFRAVHTIKGSSRMLKLSGIGETAHRLEDIFGALREGSVKASPEILQLLFRGIDGLSDLVERLTRGERQAQADPSLLDALASPLRAEGEASGVGPMPAPAAAETAPAAAESAPASVAAGAEPEIKAPAEVRLKTPETVRIKLEKLDELIKLMGELVSTHAESLRRLEDLREIEGMRFAPECGAEERLRILRSEIRGFGKELRDEVLQREALMGELHGKALLMRMLPLSIVFEPAARMIRELAKGLGKEVECALRGSEIELDRQIIDGLWEPVMHLLRNAVDHGIESPEARKSAGKAPRGTVSLSARHEAGSVVIEISDDGGGLPMEAIREKALRKGYMSAEKLAAASPRQIAELVFLPGFSTSPIITDISGRGVGLDVVRKTVVEGLRGSLSMDYSPASGTRFSLRLPLTLALMRILLVKAAGYSFGFPAARVSELLAAGEGEILDIAGRPAIAIRDEFVPIVHLGALTLGSRPPRSEGPSAKDAGAKDAGAKGAGLRLLVVHDRAEKLALVIDELVDERDMVIKSLPAHMRSLDMVSGVVATGKDELVSVLHVPALMERARSARGEALGAAPVRGAGRGPVEVLVVDDSLNTREIEKDVLEAHGYRITLAEDGVDGLSKARQRAFDAILTDIEMPRMDGFALTRKLREEERYRDTPIIIVTSRRTEEDKRRGIQAGADAYIVKGDFEQSSLLDTLRQLGL